MEIAYFLINCNAGYKGPIIEELKKMESIPRFMALRIYDIIAKFRIKNP